MTTHAQGRRRYLILLSVLAILAGWCTSASAQLASGPWPMFRHDISHSGVSQYGDPTPSGSVWSLSIGNGLSSPVIGSDGTIYLSGGSSSLQALNPDGTPKWSKSISSTTRSTPALGADGNVYIGSTGRLYAYGTDGTFKWYYSVSGDVTSSPAIGPDGVVYIGSRGGYLYALIPGATSASKKWQFATGDMHMTSPVVSADGATIYTGGGTSLWAINTADGTQKWRYSIGVSMTSSAALSSDGSTVYIGAYDGNLYAVNTADGSLKWQVQVGFKNAATSASPAIGPDGTIYLGSNYGSLYAITPDGDQKWIYESRADSTSDRDIRSSVAINADGTVILASYDGYVHAINSATGIAKWRYLLPGKNYASPAIAADGTIVTATMSGIVYGNISGAVAAATPPSDLQLSLPTDTSITLTWADNSTDEYGFRIERRVGTVGPYTFLKNVGANTTSTTDSGLQSGQIYCYRVCAYQQGGLSAYSNEASISTPGLMTPTGLTATPVDGNHVALTWTDNSPDELGFVIERSSGPNGLFEVVDVVGADVIAYTDHCVYPTTNYYYRVRAYDADRYSSYSNEDWALTPGADLSDEIVYGNRDRKQMALTFDAGTAAIRTGLLNTLRANGVYCTMFLTGYVTEVQKSQVAQIARDGHHVGNHSYDHPDLRYCSEEQIAWQLAYTDEIIRNASGHHTQSFYRAPYGARDEYSLNVAADAGYRHVAWSGDSGDAGGASTQQVIDRTMAAAGNGVVMLYHCTIASTEAAIQTVIDGLKGQGYELVTVPELIAPAQVSSTPSEVGVGYNLISLPIEPALPFPHIIFRGLPIDQNLFRWNNQSVSDQPYDVLHPELFGNINSDGGYWLYMSAPGTIKFNGTPITGERRIKLPYLPDNPYAWSLIGYPFETAQDFRNCKVYNPNAEEPKTRSVLEATDLGWIPCAFFAWDSATQSQYDVGVEEYFPYSTMLEPWHGYQVRGNLPGLELIIPAPQ